MDIKSFFSCLHVPLLESPHAPQRGVTRSLETTVLSTTGQFRDIPFNHHGTEDQIIMEIFNFLSLHKEIEMATMTAWEGRRR
jgi:hypothetical protein